MLDYVNQTLGLDAKIRPWAEAGRFPLYLRSGKEYFLLSIGEIECVLIEADENSFNLPVFLKQMGRLPCEPDHVVLCFKRMDSKKRKALIEAGLPFIVPGSQIYLPFLGTVLQERGNPYRLQVRGLRGQLH